MCHVLAHVARLLLLWVVNNIVPVVPFGIGVVTGGSKVRRHCGTYTTSGHEIARVPVWVAIQFFKFIQEGGGMPCFPPAALVSYNEHIANFLSKGWQQALLGQILDHIWQ